MKKILSAILKGLVNGGTAGLGQHVIKFIKDFKNLKNSEAYKYLDLNGDGKVDFEDVQALQLETFFKIIGFALLVWFLSNYDKILDGFF